MVAIFPSSLHAALRASGGRLSCPLATATGATSRRTESESSRSSVSRSVSSQALATTGSLLSMEVSMPRRKVEVKLLPGEGEGEEEEDPLVARGTEG